MSYAATIEPFQQRKNGRAAFNAMVGQCTGTDEWMAEIKKQEALLHTQAWKGQSSFSLEKFIAQHRNASVLMAQCAEHAQCQLPNQRTRVTCSLNATKCGDAELQAVKASTKQDTAVDGLSNNFEAAVAVPLPADPVAKRRASGKRGTAETLDTCAEISGSEVKKKANIGKTGVHFRFYKQSECNELSEDQKEELRQHRKNAKLKKNQANDGSESGSSWKKIKEKSKKFVAAAVEKHVNKLKAESEAEDDDETAKNCIMSLFSDEKKTALRASGRTTKANASALNSILRKVKNSKDENRQEI